MANSPHAAAPRLLFFGLDGATFDLLLPWAEQGLLPNLASLLERGAHGPLQSTTPPITPCAWTSMMTGTNPGRHGVFDFVLPRPGTYGRRITTAADRQATPVWLLAKQAGLTCGVVNIPTTYPPDDVAGYMVSGMMGAPAYKPDVVRPASLFEELQEAIGGFPMEPVNRTSRGYSLAALDAQIANREAAFRYLLDTHPTDLFLGVVNFVDHLEHFFFTDREWESEGRHVEDMLLYGYQAADRLLGEVLHHAGPDTNVVVASDHGAGPLVHFLNVDRLLLETGLLRFKSGEGQRGHGGLLRRLGALTPDWVRDRLPKQLRRRALEAVRKEYEGEVDWQHTRLYRRGTGLGLDVNLQGREPEGIVPPEQYEQVRDEVIALLTKTLERYPQLGKVRFHRREELYEGPALELAADIILAPAGYSVELTPSPHPEAGVAVSHADMARWDAPKRWKIGTHRMDGVFIAAGPAIAPQSQTRDAQIHDVAPTLLRLSGLDVPAGLDGRVLTEILYWQQETGGSGRE